MVEERFKDPVGRRHEHDINFSIPKKIYEKTFIMDRRCRLKLLKFPKYS